MFPSTTMAALTTLHTARAPAEHGYLGLTVWLDEAQAVVNLIRLYDVYTHAPGGRGLSGRRAVPVPPDE